MTPIKNKQIIFSTDSICFNDNHIYVLYVTEDKLTIRGLAPLGTLFGEFEHNEVTKESLLTHDLFMRNTSLINNSNIYYLMVADVKYYLVYESTLTLSEAIAHGSWHAHGNCHVMLPSFKRLVSTLYDRFVADDLASCSLFKETLTSKATEHGFVSNHRRQTAMDNAVEFIVLHDDDNFLSASCIVRTHDLNQTWTNLVPNKVVNTNRSNTRMLFSELYITYELIGPDSINPNSECEFIIKSKLGDSYYPDNCSLHLEMVDGYAPHRRITISNGVGKFKVMSLGLTYNEQLRFKINDNGYTSVIEKVLDVK